MKKSEGIVYLIGAGPGDPDLITVKGKKLLAAVDTVVYDALVNQLLITSLPSSIKKIFVGKRGGKHSARQSEINRIIVQEAKKGKKVARVKGGDPLVFGRGSEEMEYLVEKGVRFEVIPGITSSIAAPTYAGIPVTHRSVSRSFAVVTGHLQAGETIASLELPQADTIVFLMAMANLPALVDKLIAAKRFTKRTPAALIQNGSHPDQKVVGGTLGSIVSLKEKRILRHRWHSLSVKPSGLQKRFHGGKHHHSRGYVLRFYAPMNNLKNWWKRFWRRGLPFFLFRYSKSYREAKISNG